MYTWGEGEGWGSGIVVICFNMTDGSACKRVQNNVTQCEFVTAQNNLSEYGCSTLSRRPGVVITGCMGNSAAQNCSVWGRGISITGYVSQKGCMWVHRMYVCHRTYLKSVGST